MRSLKPIVAAAAAPAAAIFIFGVIYGSLAGPEIGAWETMLSSLVIYSGSVQFTLIALLASGGGVATLVAGAAALNLRNLVLAAVLRPRVHLSPLRRGALGWFLTDEATGLALASDEESPRVLVVAGTLFYLSWQSGTAMGLAGASLESLSDAAGAVFPVLFIGLAAATRPSKSVAVRAALAAVAAGLASWLWPGAQGIAAVGAAIAVSIPGGDS